MLKNMGISVLLIDLSLINIKLECTHKAEDIKF